MPKIEVAPEIEPFPETELVVEEKYRSPSPRTKKIRRIKEKMAQRREQLVEEKPPIIK